MSSEVPEGWQISSIEDLLTPECLFSDGDWVESKDQDPAGTNRLLQLADIGDGQFRDRSKRFMNDEQFTRLNCTQLLEGDILIARMPEPIGRACILPRLGNRSATVVDIAILRPSVVDSYWLMSVINSSSFRTKIEEQSSGTTRTRIGRTALSQIKIVTPPLPEQKKIVSILTSVDEVIENTQKQIDKLQDLKKATMNELLTKGIGHTKFKDSELGQIPKSWEVQPLRVLTTKIGSGVTPRGGSSVYQDHGIIFIRSQNVHFDGLMLKDVAYISEQTHAGMKGSMVCGGDVLLNITGASLGRCTVVPNDFLEGNVNQHVCIIRPISSLYNKFLGIWLSSDYGQDQIMRFQAGGNREGLNFEQIRSIKIPVPSMQEQEKVSEVVDSIQVSISEVQRKLHQTQSLKKSLMQDLLTGKVRVAVN